MAHYKRKRCRYQAHWKYPAQAFIRKRLGLRPVNPNHHDYSSEEWRRLWPDGTGHPCNHSPRWADILWHSRPRRHKDRAECRRVVSGNVDPDEALWQLEKKPHIYYW